MDLSPERHLSLFCECFKCQNICCLSGFCATHSKIWMTTRGTCSFIWRGNLKWCRGAVAAMSSDTSGGTALELIQPEITFIKQVLGQEVLGERSKDSRDHSGGVTEDYLPAWTGSHWLFKRINEMGLKGNSCRFPSAGIYHLLAT